MECDVVFTSECFLWLCRQEAKPKIRIITAIGLLRERNMQLGFPHSSKIVNAGIPDLKGFSVKASGITYRILYTFEARSQSYLIIHAGETDTDELWYEKMILEAKEYYSRHIDKRATSMESGRTLEEVRSLQPYGERAALERHTDQLKRTISLRELRLIAANSQSEIPSDEATYHGDPAAIEAHADCTISALADFVDTLGGDLELIAHLNGKTYTLMVPAMTSGGEDEY